MSYSCEISFKTIKEGELHSFFQRLKKEVSERFNEIAADNYPFCPTERIDYKYGIKDFDKTPAVILRDLTDGWAYRIFTYRYVYLSEHNILGVFGVPDSVHGIFDLTCYFQDSCDRDYPFEDWKGIETFEQIAEKWKSASNEMVAKQYSKTHYGEEMEEDVKGDTEEYDYYRRTFAYDEIWDMFEGTLEKHSEAVYISLFGFYEGHLMTAFVELCKEQAEKERKKFEEQHKNCITASTDNIT